MRMSIVSVWAVTFVVLSFGWTLKANAEVVDLGKPFETDGKTICLFHLDDVAGGVVADAVPGGKSGRVEDAKAAQGKFGKALNCDGSKGWADIADLPKMEGLTALTAECWVKFRDRARGDVLCRGGQYMIRLDGTVTAGFWIDGGWKNVKGTLSVPANRWTHLAITWDQTSKKVGIYVNGRLDVAQVPEGVTDGKLGGGERMLRLGGHTWTSPAPQLNGQLDEVRISSVVREYAPLPGSKKLEGTTRRTTTRREAGPAKPKAPSKYVFRWGMDADATDKAKSHVEKISKGTHKYTVVQDGTMDGRHMRTPMGCGMNREGAFFQTWESNRSVRMENVGTTDLVNPWLSNGRNNFRSVQDIINSAVTPDMTDAEKAFAIWFQQIRHRHHSPGDNPELGDPVKVLNIYGYNTCGNDSLCLGSLWKAAGFKTAPARGLGHCISQVFYDGGWHLHDGDLHCVYLLRDNKTVASDVQMARDHDLIKRTHSNGILLRDSWWNGQGAAAWYFTESEITGERFRKVDTTMNMVLRPGEAIVWRWGFYNPVKYHGKLQTAPTYKDIFCNGLWEYRPDLTKKTWRTGATSVENVVPGPDGLTVEQGKTGTIVWTMKSPYIFVGGRIESEGAGAKFFICQDGKTWRPVADSMDRYFSIVGPAYYEYQLKCELQGGAVLKKLAIINDVQMAPFALPDMVVGKNAFTYTDDSPGKRRVVITHNWVERSATRPPSAPTVVYPPDGGESDGTDVVFTWTVPTDPDGDDIGDYQFELSRRADMKLPVSMDFYKLISRTGDVVRKRNEQTRKMELVSVKNQYTLGQAGQYTQGKPGLLTPDTTYYWHVRARDSKDLWGPWSKTWSFTARGAAYPVDVTLEWDAAKRVGTLKWKANPVGRKPAKYRVYGSNEKGFTVGDRAYSSVVGVTKKEMAAYTPRFPANFIAETTQTQMAVIGAGVDNPTANKTYYRVVAVDEKDKRSGPSDYVTAPRPIIYGKPVLTAKVGQEYSYQVTANRSIGHLSSRVVNKGQKSGYWDIETPKFALVQGPAWLKIDETTGMLSGTPNAAGKEKVEVTATIDRTVRKLDEAKLIWGQEKVLSETPERVGTATQKFVIEIIK